MKYYFLKIKKDAKEKNKKYLLYNIQLHFIRKEALYNCVLQFIKEGGVLACIYL